MSLSAQRKIFLLCNGVQSAFFAPSAPPIQVVTTYFGNKSLAASAVFSPSTNKITAVGREIISCKLYNNLGVSSPRQAHFDCLPFDL